MKSIFKLNSALFVAIVCILTFLIMFAMMGYSSGYGKIVDGSVSFDRKPLFYTMMEDYGKEGAEWGFGYFVPFAVMGLFWLKSKELLQIPVNPSLFCGGGALCFALVLYWAGYRGEQKYLGFVSGQILVAGMILWFLGWNWFRKAFWLWALLGMMWPWRILIEPISAPLQKLLASLTAGFLKLFGVGAVANGSSVSTDSADPITSKFISLDIDVACSGMRSLFALVMIGFVFAFLRVKDEWKRWILVMCVPMIAVLGNFVRMLLLYGGSRIWGTGFAIGENHQMSPYHMIAGLVVFGVALALMSVLVELLERGKNFFKRSQIVRKTVVNN